MSYVFTVFTSAYNRAHTLHRVYESLCTQTFRDFEWLIVDDGSTDATGATVKRWQEEADFPIRYVRKENGGKHTAFNRGVQEARGELFLNLDSDDACVPTALERLKFRWDAVPEEQKSRLCGLTALCKRPDGEQVGRGLAHDVIDCSPLELNYRLGYSFQKWGFIRTDVLRRYPFPVIPGERTIPDSLVFNRIGMEYATRFVNDVLCIYYPPDGSWNASKSRCPRGSQLYYRELAGMPIPLRWKLRGWLNWLRCSLYLVAQAGKRA